MPGKNSLDDKMENILFYQIEKVMRNSARYTHRVFESAGVDLTKDQWLVLKKVNDEDGIAPREIARFLDKEPASITRILDILTRKQLLNREANPEDRRSSLIFPTPAGRKVYKSVLPLVKQIRTQAVTGLSQEEQTTFRAMLRKMAENMA